MVFPFPLRREAEHGRDHGRGPNLIGVSRAMKEVRALIGKLADAGATVLIRGDNGSGKELVAQALHHQGRRTAEPLVMVNCASLAPSLIESELFGHERGAFTHAVGRRQGCLELAQDGTLFLDEVAELSPELQAKLLRVLEARRFQRVGGTEELTFGARVVAATHQDLERRIAEGRFREDLYYRLNVVSIRVPALEERTEDIPLLAAHFLRHTGSALHLGDAALDWLVRRGWPGNVRELRNAMERLALLCDEELVTPEALQRIVRPARQRPKAAWPDAAPEATLEALARQIVLMDAGGENKLDLIEAAMVRAALELSKNNQTQAAKLLGVSRKAVLRRCHRQDGADE